MVKIGGLKSWPKVTFGKKEELAMEEPCRGMPGGAGAWGEVGRGPLGGGGASWSRGGELTASDTKFHLFCG